ncbi:hypothetical protein [Bacillus sp. FJAT-47783]|uniref:hypothetical protein n=1 Tax=Bacillus sp. FJAT-47783 TaxID=2922712 RepID=UPI001FABD3FE|nr:hypothetical protein [Bacillus sp. FJAT-47783]
MTNKGMTRIQRGQAITFRIPSDTPDHIIKQLQKLKETERRNFSSKMAEFALEGVRKSLSKERETVTIPLPKQLSKEQRNWLRHSHSEALLGNIVYQLLADPVRATSVLASLNSSAVDINEALFLQESETTRSDEELKTERPLSNIGEHKEIEAVDEDLINFDLQKARQELVSSVEEVEEEDAEDLLGDFLAQMNK